MANAKQAAPSGAVITLNEKEFRFKFSLGLMCKVEELTGINLWAQDFERISPRLLHGILWATLSLQEKRKVTFEEVEAFYPLYDDEEQIALNGAIVAMLLEVQEEKEKKRKAKAKATEQKEVPMSTPEPETKAAIE